MANELKTTKKSQVSTLTKTSRILEDALSVISQQVDHMRIKSNQGFKLAQDEAYLLNSYIKSLVGLSKEEREREKAEKELHNLTNLTDEQLLELAQKKLIESRDE